MTEVELYRGGSQAWDEYVLQADDSTFFHLFEWGSVLREAFDFRPHYLAAKRGDRIVGVLPLCELGPPRRPRCLLSLPFAVDGGVCASDAEARLALERAAIDLAERRGVRHLELRDGLGGEGFHVAEGLNYRFRRAIFPTDEENLAAMRPNQRRMVRIGKQAGLAAANEPDQVDAFHSLFAHSMRRLGTPVFSREYFRCLRRRFADRSAIFLVRHGGLPVAASFVFLFKDTVAPYYVGSRREFFRLATNDFLYWEMMRWARDRGLTMFDFGRSRLGTGAFEFKRHWGFVPEPMRYRIHTRGAAPPPEKPGRLLALARAVWPRVPLPVTTALGPFLMRRFGVYHT